MMDLKTCLLIVTLATISLGIDEFKNKRQIVACIQVCNIPISACLKDHESACAKAYVHCHTQENFLTCIESANSLMMQDIGKCMRRECKPMEEPEKEQSNPITEQQSVGEQFRKFKKVQGRTVSQSDQEDIQDISQTKARATAPGDSKGDDGNR